MTMIIEITKNSFKDLSYLMCVIFRVRKGYKCHCGKSYKTAQGLKAHALQTHNNSSSSSSSSLIDNMVNNISIRSSSPSQQSIGSLSPSSISNSSSYNANSNLLSSSSPNTTSYVSTSQQTAQTTSGSVISRNNYLISIKTTNGKSQGQGGQSKILKLTTNGNGGAVDGIVVDNGEFLFFFLISGIKISAYM